MIYVEDRFAFPPAPLWYFLRGTAICRALVVTMASVVQLSAVPLPVVGICLLVCPIYVFVFVVVLMADTCFSCWTTQPLGSKHRDGDTGGKRR